MIKYPNTINIALLISCPFDFEILEGKTNKLQKNFMKQNVLNFFGEITIPNKMRSTLIENIQDNVVFLNADDDFLVPLSVVEEIKNKYSCKKNLSFIQTKKGGHMTFLDSSNSSWAAKSSSDYLYDEYINSLDFQIISNDF